MLIAACSTEPELEPLTFADGCQPLFAGEECLLPYPSDYFLVDDPSQPSGKRVAISGAAEVVSDQLQNVDSGVFRPQDGFSRNPTILFSLLEETDGEGLVRLDDDYETSRDPSTSATVLIEAGTGRRIAHFVDIDPIPAEGTPRGLMIRPLEGLPQARTSSACTACRRPRCDRCAGGFMTARPAERSRSAACGAAGALR